MTWLVVCPRGNRVGWAVGSRGRLDASGEHRFLRGDPLAVGKAVQHWCGRANPGGLRRVILFAAPRAPEALLPFLEDCWPEARRIWLPELDGLPPRMTAGQFEGRGRRLGAKGGLHEALAACAVVYGPRTRRAPVRPPALPGGGEAGPVAGVAGGF